MPVVEVKGNLLTSDCNVIAQGCNCFNTMGSGLAAQIKVYFPEAFQADSRTTPGDQAKLGFYSYANSKGKLIVNLYTQYRYGTDQRHLDYEALAKCLNHLKGIVDSVTQYKEVKLGLPRIGCGLAGGDWQIVRCFIEATFPDRDVYVYNL